MLPTISRLFVDPTLQNLFDLVLTLLQFTRPAIFGQQAFVKVDPIGLVTSIRADSAWNGIVWELYGFVALVFFVTCYSMGRYSRYLERKLRTDNH